MLDKTWSVTSLSIFLIPQRYNLSETSKNHIFPILVERDCVLYMRVRVDLAIAQVSYRFDSCLCAIDSTGITRLLSRYSDNLASFESTLHRVTECILPESQMIRRSNRYNIYFEYV